MRNTMRRWFVMMLVMMTVVQALACAAITKKGTQCKRAPSPGSQYCWQHGGTTKAQRAAGLTDAEVSKMRCKATTKAGTQCKRTAKVGSEYCWQHGGEHGEVAKSASTATTVKPEAESISTESTDATAKSVQCDAMKKDGTRCSRKAQIGGTKCWQHAK